VIHKGGAFTKAFPWAARRGSNKKMVLVLEEVGEPLKLTLKFLMAAAHDLHCTSV
jgi:hypothetical protein